jgi:hypothetical protein
MKELSSMLAVMTALLAVSYYLADRLADRLTEKVAVQSVRTAAKLSEKEEELCAVYRRWSVKEKEFVSSMERICAR